MIPFIVPALIAAFGGLGAAKISSSASSGTAKSISAQQLQMAREAQARTRPAYDQAYDYYSKILSGEPGAMMKSLGPEISFSNEQYAAARKNLMEQSYGRSGGLDRAYDMLAGRQASDVTGMYGRLRPQAAAALSSLASGDQRASLSALADANQSVAQQNVLSQTKSDILGALLARIFDPSAWSKFYSKTPSLTPSGQGRTPLDMRSFIPPAVNPSSGVTYGNLLPYAGNPQTSIFPY